jgi:hypothetical protein
MPPSPQAPPRLAQWLLSVTAVRRFRAAQLGDLEEEFHERAQRDLTGARHWYWRQAIGSVGPNLLWSTKSLWC